MGNIAKSLAILIVALAVTAGAQHRRWLIAPKPAPGGGGSWTPASLTLEYWFRADYITNSDGAAIDTWPDATSNHRDIYQATAANKPIFTNSVGSANSQKGLWFFRGDDFAFLTRPGTSLSRPITFHVAAKMRPKTWAENNHTLFYSTNGSSTIEMLWNKNNENIVCLDGSYTFNVIVGAALTNVVWTLVVKSTPATSELYTNGVLAASGALSAASQAFDGITVGARPNNVYGWQGFIFDVAVQNGAASASDIANFYQWATNKYGY